ncbi:sulfite reductase flavoprotein alpha-component [Purpureocillium lilacinum]|uniref:Sulfite reductase flavoprotein alpha-component n=1 Tax=Purpureocillium lilacinum TaxID=33203 RepID=A0A179H957_PURLI|nr:sulfite reductase flavoprotein alpha-component [Purpureocillium lilacinum]
MTSSDRTVLVLYGSETGNAQDMAEELGKLCRRLHFKSRVEELDSVELTALLEHQLVIFVISTTGQGDMPHNSLLFWKKLLRKRLPRDCLARVRFTCCGLGDSTYLKFNWAARKLIRRLEQLGGTTFMEPCEADEQFPEGVDGSFLRWADDLRKVLLAQYPLRQSLQPIPDEMNLPPRWSLHAALRKAEADSIATGLHGDLNGSAEPPRSNTPPLNLIPVTNGWNASLAGNEKMTPDTHWQDVRLMSFDIPSRGQNQKLHCNPGDCLTIYPKNFPDDAQRLITLMGWGSVADKPLDLSFIDFMAVPRRSFLKNISYFSSNPDHKERLLEFTMTEFLDEYFDYATRSRRTIVETLEEFSSVRIPPERILDVFPLIRGRDFSIANGGDQLAHPTSAGTTRVELLVALVKYRTILRKPRQGLCSRYLADLPVGTELLVTHKPVLSPIHGPSNAQRPLIAMATGTGVAPVRSLIHERLTHPVSAPIVLFFGNRNVAADYFFSEEWGAIPQDKMTLFTAFSRDQREKVYVQDLVRREAPRLERLIPQLPIFAVCGGSTKMADACKNAVFDPFVEAGDESERKRMLEEITWWQEIW